MDNQTKIRIRDYIEEHGFGKQTQTLTRKLSADEFSQGYYSKQELVNFCRSHGIPATGLKPDLNLRIKTYLRTGKIEPASSKGKTGIPDSAGGLRLDKQVIHYKSDLATREFFAVHITDFSGFSAYVQKWLKARLENGELFTYADVINEHIRYMKKKKKGAYNVWLMIPVNSTSLLWITTRIVPVNLTLRKRPGYSFETLLEARPMNDIRKKYYG